MSDGSVDALEQAIALYRAPARLSAAHQRPLVNALLLLRIAADDRAAIALAVQACGETTETVSGAALLYIQQVLFADGADAYRLLGAQPDDDTAQIREHYRWLMRWLHPDRQPERWEVAYSERVNQAWQILRSTDRRRAYDRSLEKTHPETYTSAARAQRLQRDARAIPAQPLLSRKLARRLPRIVLGALGLGAMLALGLLFFLRDQAPIAESTALHGNDTLVSTPTAAVAGVQLATMPAPQQTAPAAAAWTRNAQFAGLLADTPVAEPAPAAATALAQAYVHAYANGDLPAMMGLFSADAVGNRGGVNAIATGFDTLFRATRSRELQLQDLTWTSPDPDRMLGIGPFKAILRWRGESTDRQVRGWITIDARRVDGHWRIQRLMHRNAR